MKNVSASRMAHVGTGVQMAAVGPQNKHLDLDPRVTYFYTKAPRASTFASEPLEELPLQTAGFGKTVVFEVAPRGDLLGDMHLRFHIPAVQPRLGVDLPTQSPLPAAWRTDWPAVQHTAEVEAGSFVLGPAPVRIGLSSSAADLPRTVAAREMPDGRGTAWEVVLGHGAARWEGAAFSSGYVVSTLHGGPARTLTVGAATFRQKPDASVCVVAAPDGRVHAENDRWSSPLAYVLMRRVRFVVDDMVLHDHERLWYDLCDRLSLRQGHARGLDEMLGVGLSMGLPHTLLLPLKFMCCSGAQTPRAFFPVVLVPNCRVRVELELEEFALAAPQGLVAPTSPPRSLDIRLIAERVWLDADERNTMLLRPLTLMYESTQDMDAVNYTQANDGSIAPSARVAVDLSELNLPVKALAWVVYPEVVPPFFEYLGLVDSAALQFGSLDRAAADGDTFRWQQTWSHARRCQAGSNVYMYSFALRAWGESPCGAADFSALQKPVLRLQLRPEAAARQLKCKVWGVTYNWLKFERGRLTRVFST